MSSPTKNTLIKALKYIIYFLVIFFAIQYFMQRNMAKGEAPAIQSTSVAGQSINLDTYQGKPLMLHFWASWCSICKLEEGTISALNTDSDTQLLTVAFQSGTTDEVKTFMQKQSIDAWPVIMDEDGTLSSQYGVTSVPATFFIDSSGKIRFKTIGLTSKWGMQARLWLASFY